MVRLSILKNHKNQILDAIIQSSILDPLDLNVDQFGNGAQTSKI